MHDRVEHDQVIRLLYDSGEITGFALKQFDVIQIESLCLLLHLSQYIGREVGRAIRNARGGKPEKQQTRPTANLQHALRTLSSDTLYRRINPLAHLIGRYRLLRVATLPAAEIECGIIARSICRIGHVPDRPPVPNALLWIVHLHVL